MFGAVGRLGPRVGAREVRRVDEVERTACVVLGQRDVADLRPWSPVGRFQHRRLEGAETTLRLQRDLELGQQLVGRVAEPLEQAPIHREDEALALAQHVSPAGQVEEHRDRWRQRVGGVEERFELVRVGPREEPLGRRATLDDRVGQGVADGLGEGALPGAEESADPDVGRLAGVARCIGVDVDELLEVLADVLGDDVLVDLVGHDRLVGEVDVDHRLDRTLDIAAEQLPDLHERSPRGTMRAR